MSGSLFYDLNGLEQIAVNLFYGWGYNFYRLENQLRADDLLVRSKVSFLLGLSRGMIETVQSAYRKKHLPLPTREHPRPDPEALFTAGLLEELSGLIGQLEGRIRVLPVPENDRMTQRYRQEAAVLLTLRNCDVHLVGRADTLRGLLSGKDAEWMVRNEATIREALSLMQQDLNDRQNLLQ